MRPSNPNECPFVRIALLSTHTSLTPKCSNMTPSPPFSRAGSASDWCSLIYLRSAPSIPGARRLFTGLVWGGQHYKIIREKSSEGLSPVFLLLGSTSSASGMLNVCVLHSCLRIGWTKLTSRAELRSSGLSSGVVGPSYVHLTSVSPCRTGTDPFVCIGPWPVFRIDWRDYTSLASVVIVHHYVRTPTFALRPYSLTVVYICAASSST